MPISDLYVVEHLLEETVSDCLVWREEDSGGWFADRNGVHIDITVSQSRTGPRVYVTVSHDTDKVHIAEPLSTGVLRPKYGNPDDMRLARALRELTDAVEAQAARREKRAREAAGQIRESLFRRLVLGVTEEPEIATSLQWQR